MNLEKITQKIWEKILIYNIRMKNKTALLDDFRWHCWDVLCSRKPEQAQELMIWVHFLIINDLPDFNPVERHDFAVKKRLESGWKLGKCKNNFLKTDPYLIPFTKCPDVIQEWLSGKDRIMINVLKKEWGNL